ncbi:MAG: hypothetical protein BGP06_21245 [Rhizobiales bacterium 65-9]|nr:hypothetical protein [Hyphomicrobiales bacterium]OJY36534.1 MAG: hypothetical protein BGP06_21245 [Rhizobiales bacterium 65-9]
MFGFSPATIAACTIAALAITTAIMPAGVNAQFGKDETRLVATESSSPRILGRGPSVSDGCLVMTERKLRSDGAYDVNKFRVCE